MTPAARVQAAIEILDLVIASARDDGPPADVDRQPAISRRAAMPGRRTGGRCANWSSRAIRAVGRAAAERPRGDARAGRRGRRACGAVRRLGAWAGADRRGRGGAPARGSSRAWIEAGTVAAGRRPTNGRRCSTARRSTCASMSRAPPATPLLASVRRGSNRRRSARGAFACRRTAAIDQHPAYLDGLVEVQDEGSQLIALACAPRRRHAASSTCAPGRAARRWRWRPRRREREIIACDTNRARLSQLAPRAERGPARRSKRACSTAAREAEQLADLAGPGRRRAGRRAVLGQRAPGGATPKGAGG